jgi:gluconolactonase
VRGRRPRPRVPRLARGAFTVVAEYDGEPNGLKIHKDGRIFIADFKNGIVVLDPETGRVTPFLQRVRLERLKAVNDLVFAANGDLYVTDQGLSGWHDPTGRVFRVRAEGGRVDRLLDNVPSPNGLVLNLDETALYVAVTRANAIWRVPLLPDGGVAKVGTFIQMSGGTGPDGLALDEAGNLAVAHVGMGAVWLFSRQGEPLYRINSCTGLGPTNVAYGGPDRRDLFITESETGTILRARLKVPGRRMFSGV